MARPVMATAPLPTAGILFNRKMPRGEDGADVPMLGRDLKEQDGKTWLFNNGKDFTSMADDAKGKRRIPLTSVVNRVGDCGVCGLTAAQVIWLLNLLCFAIHTTMFFLTCYFAWWSKDLSQYSESPYLLRIYRVSATWTNSTTQGYELKMVDNEMPIDIAILTALFFGITMLAHLYFLVLGLCECSWMLIWRQIDDAFCYWRWIEYSASASIMALALSAVCGIREQNTLAYTFVSIWLMCMLGLYNELYSRPVVEADTTAYGWEKGPDKITGVPDLTKDRTALRSVSQLYWEGDRIVRDENASIVATGSRDTLLRAQRFSNYLRRQPCFVLGFFPFITWVVILINHLEQAKSDLRDLNTGLEIPQFVNTLLYGTITIYASFSFVMPVFQALSPQYYFGTEICYCILSALAKVFLGSVLLVNVLMVEARAEDLLGAGALVR